MNRFTRVASLLAVAASASFAAPILSVFAGQFALEGNVQLFTIEEVGADTISVRTFGYGGWNPLMIPAGGFAPSLSLYDPAGNQLAHDFVGGSAVGPGCSNGAQQDPVTHFCFDATLSFPVVAAGNYILALSVQGNDGQDPFGFPNPPNSGNGTFPDPVTSGNRTGNWALSITTSGTIIPEPSTALLGLAGLAILAIARLKRTRLQ